MATFSRSPRLRPDELAIGGDFTKVIQPAAGGGTTTVLATDFAVISETNGQVLFAGQTVGTGTDSATNGYVRAITSFGGVTYIGGDFTSVGAPGRHPNRAQLCSGARLVVQRDCVGPNSDRHRAWPSPLTPTTST